MKYFIDTEFIEGFNKPLFVKRRHFIDLISIGIVCEDGRTYSAISNEYKYNNADKWVQENVIDPLYISTVSGDGRNRCNSKNFQYVYGKSNTQIAEEIRNFIYSENIKDGGQLVLGKFFFNKIPEPEFYGYYADYDWVLFCSLFGRMIDLPKGFPMYCRDLKQMLDNIADHDFHLLDKQENRLNIIKNHPNYPKQENEHNALSDAKWNYDLYKFLKSL